MNLNNEETGVEGVGGVWYNEQKSKRIPFATFIILNTKQGKENKKYDWF